MSNRSNKWRQVGGRNRNANYNMIHVPLYTKTIINNNYGLTDKSNPPEVVDGKVILRDNIGIAGALDISGSCSGVTSTNESGYEFATLDWVNNKISGIQNSLCILNDLTQQVNDAQARIELQKQTITDLSKNITSNAVVEDVVQRINTIQDTITLYKDKVNKLTTTTATSHSVNELSKRLHNAQKLFDDQKTQLTTVTKNTKHVQLSLGELSIQMDNTNRLIDKQASNIRSLATDTCPILSTDINKLTTELNGALKLIEQQSNDINKIGLHVRANEDFLFTQVVKYDTCLEQNKSTIQSTLLKTTSQEKQLKVFNRAITQQSNDINTIGLHVRSNEDFLFTQVVKYDTCLEQNKSMIQSTLLKTTSQEKQLKVFNRAITQQNNNIKYIKQSLPSDTLQVPK